MSDLLATIECDYEGRIIHVKRLIIQGNDKDNEIKEIVKNILYIIQDIAIIKSKLANTGNFLKLVMKNSMSHYEIALGTNLIRINKYRA